MYQGRGNAVCTTALVMLCLLVVVQGATYTVGGPGGWTFNVAGWPKGKSFRAGDTLVFNYNSGLHNVVAVGRTGYSACTTPRGAKVYQTGTDQIRLVKGQNFFICNFPGHCESGMKIALTAM